MPGCSRSPLHINSLIDEALALLQDDLQRHRISVKAERSPRLLRVLGDRVQLQQVLLNLITNAIEAMATVDGLRVLVVGSDVRDDGGVMISITDSGTGISPQDVERVFSPLFTTKSGGMGMGRSIIEAHGGSLWVVPNAPRGSVFQFVLRADTTTPLGMQ